jgi:peptide/nickel transport system substrate-binding protein
VPNKYWNPAEDPNAKQLASKIVVSMNINANDIDNRMLASEIDVNMAGTGAQAAARARMLASPTLKRYADDGYSGFLYFAYLNAKVIPDVHCREAIEYAADKTTLQTAYGGPIAGGSIASTVLTPEVLGYRPLDLYDALTKPAGDYAAARQQLELCGKPNGFSTDIAYRTDMPAEASAAQALQAALSGAGIKTALRGYPTSSYYSDFAGAPRYVQSHDLGIAMGAWEPDWPDGYGMLDEISNGNAIVPAGNTNTGELNDPLVNELFAKAGGLSSATQRAAIWGQIDHRIMSDAAILPIVYAKALQYRNPNLTNAYLQSYYGMYNYAVLGLK